MSESRCVHDMLPGQCATCLGHKDPAQEEHERNVRLLRQRGVLSSGYAGRCAECGTGFPPGTPIRPAKPARRGWIAACCIQEDS